MAPCSVSGCGRRGGCIFEQPLGERGLVFVRDTFWTQRAPTGTENEYCLDEYVAVYAVSSGPPDPSTPKAWRTAAVPDAFGCFNNKETH